MLFLIPILILIVFLYFFKNTFLAIFSSIVSIFILINCSNNLGIIKNINLLLETSYFVLTSHSNYCVVLFLILISWAILILTESQVMESYKFYISRYINSKRALELNIIWPSLLLCLDDWLIMTSLKNFYFPLIAYYKISKERFGYFLSNIAPCLTSLNPFSTWGALFLVQLGIIKQQLGISTSIFDLLIGSIPFFFYQIIAILISLISIIKQKTIGFMINYESKSNFNKVNFSKNKSNKNKYDFLIFILLPIFLYGTIIFNIIKIIKASPGLSFSESMGNFDAAPILVKGVLYGIFAIIIFLIFIKSLDYRFFLRTAKENIISFIKPASMLFSSWIFAKCLYLVIDSKSLSLFIEVNESLNIFLPVIFMFMAMIMAAIMGTEWGAISMISPLICLVPINCNISLLFAAVVSGATAGTQLSPLSNTVVTASVIAEISSFDLFKAQNAYVVLSIVLSIIGFLVSGVLFNLFLFQKNIVIVISWIFITLFVPIFYILIDKIYKRLQN
jgi:tetracycline resistance efflux pump